MTEIKQTRTPKGAASITKGALALPFEEQVTLLKALNESLQAEMDRRQQSAKEAENLLNGLKK